MQMMMSEIDYTLEYNAVTHMAVIICMKFSLDVMDMILNLNARIKKRYYK